WNRHGSGIRPPTAADPSRRRSVARVGPVRGSCNPTATRTSGGNVPSMTRHNGWLWAGFAYGASPFLISAIRRTRAFHSADAVHITQAHFVGEGGPLDADRRSIQ